MVEYTTLLSLVSFIYDGVTGNQASETGTQGVMGVGTGELKGARPHRDSHAITKTLDL